MIDTFEIDIAAMHRHMAGIPKRSGLYYWTTPHTSASTNAALGVGTGRFSPWRLMRATSFTKIGAEISSAGEAGSLLRIGIYADNGTGYPGALALDAGTIAGDSATVQEIAVAFTLPAGLYWVGGVVQNVSTTQPTVRVIAQDLSGEMPAAAGSTPAAPAANGAIYAAFVGFSMTGAFPASWPTSTPNISAVAARIFVKTA